MYKQIKTDNSYVLDNGSTSVPVATFQDECDSKCQIGIDDGCYVIGIEMSDGTYKWTTHIFSEVLEVLRTLPPLSGNIETRLEDILSIT